MQEALLTPSGLMPVRGRVFVHFGDWRDVADRWPRDGVPVFDPPYGINYESNWRLGYDRSRSDRKRQLADAIIGDKNTSERDAMLDREWSAAAVFGPARLDRIAPWVRRDADGEIVEEPRVILVWDKGEGVGMGDLSLPWRPNTETIAIYGDGWSGKRTSSVLHGRVLAFGRSSNPHSGRRHPHEKPLAVVAEIIGKAPSGRPIIDSHAGSGTMLLVAALLGRDAYGAEIDPQYKDVILGRLAGDAIDVEIW